MEVSMIKLFMNRQNWKMLLLCLTAPLLFTACGGGGGSNAGGSGTDTTAPTAPAGLAGTVASASQLDLTWTASTDAVGATGDKGYRGGTYLKAETTVTSSDTGLTASTQYCYQVAAYDAEGNESSKTSQVCGTTTAAAAAASDSLDTAFGTGGKVLTAIGTSGEIASDLGIQSDGKIVVAGYSYTISDNDFALVRYNTDGTLDATFGTGGKVTTAVGTSNDAASALGIQSDGKIVAAGSAAYQSISTTYDCALVRYNTDGTLDTSFGTGGKVIDDPMGFSYVASALRIQSDGKIVVAGPRNDSSVVFALVRYNTDGSLDTTFDTDGRVLTDIVPNNSDKPTDLRIQSDGKIVVAGYSYYQDTSDFALVRYNTDGTLDTSFGTGGKVTTDIGSGYASYDVANALGIQSDGKIVAAGGSSSNFALVRYNTDGTLDTSFGTGGKVTTAVGTSNDAAYALSIQSDGKIVAAGSSYNGSNNDFTIVRYNTDGTLDTSFGTGGEVITAIGSDDDYPYALSIQPDGKIVAAGRDDSGGHPEISRGRVLP